jgi:hypothetical protein
VAGIKCRVSIDGGIPQPITAAPTVIVMGTNGGSKPVRITHVELQSNTALLNKQIVDIAYGFYATNGTPTGGSTPIAYATEAGIQGLYTPTTTFKAITASIGGAIFTPKISWQWSLDAPFDTAFTQGSTGGSGGGNGPELNEGTRVSVVWAFFLPVGPVIPFSLTGTLDFEEAC